MNADWISFLYCTLPPTSKIRDALASLLLTLGYRRTNLRCRVVPAWR